MKFSLIICTYMRPQPLLDLLRSVQGQKLYPNEILVIDGSLDNRTGNVLKTNIFNNLKYFLIADNERGLTRQRNFGIAHVSADSEVVCFLDDDTILNENYFTELLKTYEKFPHALGVGGYIANEAQWVKTPEHYVPPSNEFGYDGWARNDGSRFVLRKRLGLDANTPPGYLPEFSHGRSIAFLPPSGKIYEVEQLMGGVSSFRKSVFKTFQFSTYFEGYGLYEDTDFTLRVSKTGKLYINTAAILAHFHHDAGRPNKYTYGKMVVRNGWYVWRVKYSRPSIMARAKWLAITILLALTRISNIFTTDKKMEAFTESSGRIAGVLSLLFSKPHVKY